MFGCVCVHTCVLACARLCVLMCVPNACMCTCVCTSESVCVCPGSIPPVHYIFMRHAVQMGPKPLLAPQSPSPLNLQPTVLWQSAAVVQLGSISSQDSSLRASCLFFQMLSLIPGLSLCVGRETTLGAELQSGAGPRLGSFRGRERRKLSVNHYGGANVEQG